MEALIKAVTEVAYDNGAVFRGQSEEFVIEFTMARLSEEFTAVELQMANEFLESLTEDELITFTTDSPEFVIKEGAMPDVDLANKILDFAFDNLP